MKLILRSLCLLLFVICIDVSAQEDLFYKGSQIKYYKVDEDFAAITQRPVTNREYIIYLQWMRGVFGPNYPSFFYESIPGFNMDSLQSLLLENRVEINMILSCSEPFVRDYMFNLKYLDYPVVGVSWQNANNYGKWLADRYNENAIIKQDFLSFAPTPTENDYFSTDACIAGKWQGQLKRYVATNDPQNPERNFLWSDNIFVPVFRLPTKKEIAIINRDQTQVNYFKAYPFSKKHFLYKWYKQYFASEKDSVLELWQYKEHNPTPERIVSNKTIQINIAGELNLDINNKSNEGNLIEIYKQNGQVQASVESYGSYCCDDGLNPYLILNEDKNAQPVFVSGYKDLEPASYKEFKIFRLACSACIKQTGKKAKK